MNVLYGQFKQTSTEVEKLSKSIFSVTDSQSIVEV